jgi:hypothetical protein
MEEKVEVEVPIVLVGKAPALESKDNTLLRGLNALTIECLPANIPARLEVNVGSLTEAGHAIRVKDITVLSDPEGVVVTIVARPKEKVEEKVVIEEAVVKPSEEAEQVEEKPKQE